MANYNFSTPKELGSDEHFTTDKDLDMDVMGNALYLVYKLKGVNDLFAARATQTEDRQGNITEELTWGTPVNTDQKTDRSPAIACYNNTLYVFWNADDSHRINYGTMDPNTLKIQYLDKLEGVKSTSGVAATVFGDKLYLNFLGDGEETRIYQTTFDGSKWDHVEPIKENQESVDAPVLAAINGDISGIYSVHRSSHNVLYWASTDTGQYDDWSDDNEVESPCKKVETDHRPGGGAWNNGFVVIHNGDKKRKHKLCLVHLNVEEDYWYGGDEIGNGFQSEDAPAFCNLNDTAYLVFADDVTSKKIMYSYSNSIF